MTLVAQRLSEVLRLKTGWTVSVDGTALVNGQRSAPVPDRELVQLLAEGVQPAAVTDELERVGNIPAVMRRRALVTALDRAGLLERAVLDESGQQVAVIAPIAVGPTTLPAVPPTWSFQPFVSASAQEGTLILQAAGGSLVLRLGPVLALRWIELTGGDPSTDEDALLLQMLLAAKVIGPPPESPSLQMWSPREWQFHCQVRDPRVSPGFAGTMRHGRLAPVPAVEALDGERIALAEPDLTTRATTERSFVDLTENRRTRRLHDDDHPITVDQIAEILFRTMRDTSTSCDSWQLTHRPVPAGGALHEIVALVAVRVADGICSGLWQYDSASHELVRRADAGADLSAMFAAAADATATGKPPQILITFAARFDRLFQKYEAIGYALILKHVGVLMHAVQLTAEAMNLACCPLGAGQLGVVERLTGADPFGFGPVGELTLGTRAPEE